jgi:hypothetical protein
MIAGASDNGKEQDRSGGLLPLNSWRSEEVSTTDGFGCVGARPER